MEIKLVACDRCPAPKPGTVPEQAERREFSFDGKRYRVDLCPQHLEQFARVWDAMQKLADSATPIAARVRNRTKKTAEPAPADPVEAPQEPSPGAFGPKLAERIRAWATENGIEVADRGRISEELRRQYYAANPPQPTPLRVSQG